MTSDTYDKQTIDTLVHRITGCDEAVDAVEDLEAAVQMLGGKTILNLLNAEHDAALAAPGAVVEMVRRLHRLMNHLEKTNRSHFDVADDVRSIAYDLERMTAPTATVSGSHLSEASNERDAIRQALEAIYLLWADAESGPHTVIGSNVEPYLRDAAANLRRALSAPVATPQQPEGEEHPPSRHCACAFCRHYFGAGELDSLRAECERLRDVLVEADRLYTNHGLHAGQMPGEFSPAGRWINSVRAALAATKEITP